LISFWLHNASEATKSHSKVPGRQRKDMLVRVVVGLLSWQVTYFELKNLKGPITTLEEGKLPSPKEFFFKYAGSGPNPNKGVRLVLQLTR
jgi:hypothetical protein